MDYFQQCCINSYKFTSHEIDWLRTFVNETGNIFQEFTQRGIFPAPRCVKSFDKSIPLLGDYLSQLSENCNIGKHNLQSLHLDAANPLMSKTAAFGHSVMVGSSHKYPKIVSACMNVLKRVCLRNEKLFGMLHKKNYKFATQLLHGFNFMVYDRVFDGGLGNDLIQNMYRHIQNINNIEDINVSFETNRKVTGLIWKNETFENCCGVIVSPIANEKRGDNSLNSDQRFNIKSKHGVKLATGGFSQNQTLCSRYFPFRTYGTCSAPGSSGDAIDWINDCNQNIAVNYNKKRIRLDNLDKAWYSQTSLEIAMKSYNIDATDQLWVLYGQCMIVVNKYGQRFMSEKLSYHNRVLISNLQNNFELTFLICDDDTINKYPILVSNYTNNNIINGKNALDLEKKIQQYLNQPTVATFTNNFKLAKNFGNNLKIAIDEFKHDNNDHDLFNRGSHIYERQMQCLGHKLYPSTNKWNENSSLNCIILVPTIMDSKGGLTTSTKSQVLFDDGSPVEGLYAAGNCAASFSNIYYFGAGATLSQAMLMGYQAGKYI